MGQFGNKFRKAREAKKLSLDDVSNVTKIGTRMLQAIEEENFDQLPGGVFNKGFIRAYAKHLGLDSEEAVTDYLACLRQAQIDANDLHTADPRKPEPRSSPAAKPNPQYTKPALKSQGQVEVEEELPDLQLPRAEDVRPPRREHLGHERSFPWATAVALVVIVIATLIGLRYTRSASKMTAANSPFITKPAAVTTTPAALTPVMKPDVSPASTDAAHPASPKPATSQSTPSSASPGSSPKTASPTKTAPAQPSSAQLQNAGTPQPPPTTTPATKPVPKMTLIIRATETSWISVTADGQLISQETLIAPAATTVHAANEIQVKVGNAAGVTFQWNGQDIPAQGAESEVKTFLFDPGGIRTLQ